MQLRIFKTLWGHAGALADAAARARANAFDGLEGPAPATAAARAEFRALLRDSPLDYIAEICTAGSYVPRRQATANEHLESFRRLAEASMECHPLFLTVIAGCDAWSIPQSVDFFAAAIDVAAALGITASFETHRSRSFFNPWTTREILRQVPDLKLTCDFSHWCVVCERLLDTEPDVLELCAERAHHVHARVGYDQGPQVPHPGAPEYHEALAAHERWWTQIWRAQAARGLTTSTLTPEFGPDGYLHCQPFTGAPVANLAEINSWIAERERRHFTELFADARRPEPATAT